MEPSKDDGELIRARASFRALAHISPELVLIHRGGEVVYINPASVRALGLASANDLVGACLADVFHQENRATVESRVRAPRADVARERKMSRALWA